MATKGKSSSNLAAHEASYNGFITLLGYGVMASVAVAALVLFLISR